MFCCHCLRLRVETNIALCAKLRDKEYNGYIMNIKRKLFSQQKKTQGTHSLCDKYTVDSNIFHDDV